MYSLPATGDMIMTFLPWLIGILVVALIAIIVVGIVRARQKKSLNDIPRGKHQR